MVACRAGGRCFVSVEDVNVMREGLENKCRFFRNGVVTFFECTDTTCRHNPNIALFSGVCLFRLTGKEMYLCTLHKAQLESMSSAEKGKDDGKENVEEAGE